MSSSRDSYDVAIVGASVAGCTAAILLGRAGARVALVERRPDPAAFKRICTHFIQPSASPTLARLGLRDEIERAGGQPSGTNIWTRYGWVSFAPEWGRTPTRRLPGLNVRRETLDPMLRGLATETPGVDLLLGQRATALVRAGATGPAHGRVDGVVVQDSDGAARELRANAVIAADGRESSIAKLAGVPEQRKPHHRFGYFAYYRETPLVTGSACQIWLQDPDVAYAFPTDGNLTLLVCTPHMDRLPEFRADPERAMMATFARLPDAPRLDPAKRDSRILGKISTPNVKRRAAQPGLALIGDAALEADPVWGVGCGWALQSGEWLADALAPVLGGSPPAVDAALRAYARRHRRNLGPHERVYSSYSTGRRFSPIERLLYRGAARDRELASTVAAIGGRWIKPQSAAMPWTLARLAWVNLSGRPPLGLDRVDARATTQVA